MPPALQGERCANLAGQGWGMDMRFAMGFILGIGVGLYLATNFGQELGRLGEVFSLASWGSIL